MSPGFDRFRPETLENLTLGSQPVAGPTDELGGVDARRGRGPASEAAAVARGLCYSVVVMTLRLARPQDVSPIIALESTAARVYAALEGYAWVVGLPAMSSEEVARAIADRGVWVVVRDGTIVGAAVCFWHGEACHLRELNVHPRHARQGLGRQLVHAVLDGARERGCRRVALTTFSEVPFNGPWYERLGFRRVAEPKGWLAEERAEEAELGLDRQPRQAMERRLDT